MKLRSGLAAVAIAGLVLTGGFWVAGTTRAVTRERPCLDEIRALCPDVGVHRARRQCLREHRDELSAACRTRIAERLARFQKLRQACGDDVKSLCSEVERGHGAIHRCLRQNQDQLSEACAVFFGRDDRI